jgi:hypothetical protein
MEAERDGEEQRRPLLSSSSPPGPPLAIEPAHLISSDLQSHPSQWNFVSAAAAAVHSSSSALRGGGGGWAGGGPEFCAAEESVAPFSSPNYYPPAPEPHHDAVYPPSIYGDVLSPSPSPAPPPPHTHGNSSVLLRTSLFLLYFFFCVIVMLTIRFEHHNVWRPFLKGRVRTVGLYYNSTKYKKLKHLISILYNP